MNKTTFLGPPVGRKNLSLPSISHTISYHHITTTLDTIQALPQHLPKKCRVFPPSRHQVDSPLRLPPPTVTTTSTVQGSQLRHLTDDLDHPSVQAFIIQDLQSPHHQTGTKLWINFKKHFEIDLLLGVSNLEISLAVAVVVVVQGMGILILLLNYLDPPLPLHQHQHYQPLPSLP